MKKLIIFPVLFLLAGLLNAQQLISIKGLVKEENGNAGVPFATLKINEAYTYTDEAGYFEAAVAQAANYLVEVQQLGYETATLSAAADGLNDLNIALKPKAFMLEQILVSDRPMHCSPQSNVICDHHKQSSQPRDVGDLFKEIPGFSVIKKGGYAMDPVFRSFKYEQINVIYDGGLQTTHACPARMDPTTTHVNPDDIDKIEVIKGPFSVRYGPSFGAIVNVVTQSFDYQKQPGIGGSVAGGYETNGNSKLAKVALHGANRQFDFLLNGDLKDYGSYSSGNGTTIPSSFNTYDYSLKAGYNMQANQRIQANWRQAFSRDVLHVGLNMDTDSDDTYIFSLDYQYKNISPRLYSITAKAYGTKVDHVMSNLRRPNAMMMEMISDVEAQTYGGRVEATLMPGRKTLVYAGVDYRYLWRDGQREMTMLRNMNGDPLPMPMTTTSTIWQDAAIQNGGIFAEGRWFATPKWTFLGGLRADLTSANIADPAPGFLERYGNVDADDQWTIGVTASATYQPAVGWLFQLALGRGARTANMIERLINHFTVGRDPYEYVGNPFLKPEVNNQVEFSVSKKTNRIKAGANVFYSYLTNYITAFVDTTIRATSMTGPMYARRFTNIDEAAQWGAELYFEWLLVKNLSANAALSYTRAQNLDWDEPLPEISPLEAGLGLLYERERWWVDARSRFVDNQDNISANFGETATPGFAVYDLRAGVEPLKGLSVGLAALNVFDRHYREHLNRAYRNQPVQNVIYEPGRNFTFFAKYSF